MANSKSAKKRVGVNKRNRLQNRYYKTSVRTLTKLFLKTLELYKVEQTPELKEKLTTTRNSIYSFLDKGVKRNVFNKNNAARKKSTLISYLRTNNI
jgi:small subunit ribosomal protein S20